MLGIDDFVEGWMQIRVRSTADVRSTLEDRHFHARSCQGIGCSETGDASPDNDDFPVAIVCHQFFALMDIAAPRTSAKIFWRVGTLTRSEKTSPCR